MPSRRIASNLLELKEDEFDLDLNLLPTSEAEDGPLIGTHTYKKSFQP